MLLEIEKKVQYNLIEETKIETVGGAFYRAQDLELGRTVAVKCVRIEGSSQKEREANYQKAVAEVRAMVLLRQEDLNIPLIYQTHYDTEKQMLYIIMEWIRGDTLAKHMQCPERQFLQWMIDLCGILERMERQRIYHKDIKPANVMITEKQKLYLIDFNITLGTSNREEGTPNYRAPEMFGLVKYVARDKADMFAVGVMLYEYYAEKVPEWPKDYAKTRPWGPDKWNKFIEPKEKNPKIPEIVNEAVVRCMRMDPKERYRRIGDLKQDLIKAVRGLNGTRKNPS